MLNCWPTNIVLDKFQDRRRMLSKITRIWFAIVYIRNGAGEYKYK